MLGEVSIRTAREGGVRCSLLSIREGLSAKEMRRAKARRRRKETKAALFEPNRFLSSRYWIETAANPRKSRRRISQIEKTGVRII